MSHAAARSSAGKAESLPTAAVEDYAKAIYSLTGWGEETASTNDLAEKLGVKAGSVSAMIKKLDAAGLVERVPYHGVRLTAEGTQVAMAVLRRHRLLELFLAEVLDVPWDRVHDEAEVLEHWLSDDLTDLISKKLDDPGFDPHGDPIPDRDLEIVETETAALADLAPGDSARFVRVSDSNPEMLAYLSECGIAVGDQLQLIERQPFDGPITVKIGSESHVLGLTLAQAMRVDHKA
ncbi:MAG: metal-dependent transcriptional regulator [Solirubrobacterales bacterium]|nr:metal-dependent transcriptional regulator [Solirubrobacterales bacterium]OJU96214.1 MAG: DtxR family transcriptional regulator [Solirubrobacterales bacterium 67-14]